MNMYYLRPITPLSTYLIAFALILLRLVSPCTVNAQSEDLTDFADIDELNHRSSKLVQADNSKERWFQPDSNYGRVFLTDRGRELILTWLGMGSSEFRIDGFEQKFQRSFCGVTAKYSSKRKNETPFILTVLIPHPRSLSSRALNLIKEFTDLEKQVTSAESVEDVRISGVQAKLALSPEQEICRIMTPLVRSGLLYIETSGCKDGKKLMEFAESLDITRLNGKLEK
jgi:hypothetical protein